jgi:predicted nucleotidyltransferase
MDPLLDRVAELVSRRSDIVAAWVFGSVARGTASANSDLDVAVLRGRAATGSLTDLPWDLAPALEQAAGRRVDLVVIDEADPDLVHRVLRDGVLVLDRDPSRRIAFEVRMRNAYFDLLPHRTQLRRAALARARKETS